MADHDMSGNAPTPEDKRARLARLLAERAAVLPPPPAHFIFPPDYDMVRKVRQFPPPLGIKGLFNRECDATNGATAAVNGRELINFSSYNYLGLSGDSDVAAAAKAAIDRYGTSVSASRLVSGQRPVHDDLERAIAGFLGTEAALAFVGGFSTNQTVVGHLFGPQDLIFQDSLIHASIQQGARQSGATVIPFPHNNPEALDNILSQRRHEGRQALVVIEGVYSMDGDLPDLARFVEIKRRHRALLMVDEAHSLGTVGMTGRGIGEYCGIDPAAVYIWMGTLSKALASCGGYIAGTRDLIDYLRLTVPGFVYSVGLPPADAAAALAALTKLRAEPERVHRLKARARYFLHKARGQGFDTGPSGDSPVVPVMTGDSRRAVHLSHLLFERGILALPITYPAVPEQKARLRFFISCDHSESQIDQTIATLAACSEMLDRASAG
jgi:8-amino-7-oxononanoate synthase